MAADVPSGRFHPDGVVGRLSAYAQLLYSSQYADTWTGGHDFQQYHLGLSAVVSPRLTIETRFRLLDQSPRLYEVTGGIRFYFSDPSVHRSRVNADGPLGAPVLFLAGGSTFYDHTGHDQSATFETSLDLPVSPRLTIGAGYRHYENRPSTSPLGTFGRIHYYFKPYPADSAWVNPDGPVGAPVVCLQAGGSSSGTEIAGKLLVPLTVRQSFWITGRIAKATDPDRTTYTAGIGTAYYFQH